MHLQFSDIYGRDKNKTGLVLGLGPSLAKHIPDIKTIDQDKDHYKIISCNNADRMTDINFDYWMLAQPADTASVFNIQNAANRYCSRPHTMLLYTDCLDLTPRHQVEKLLANIEYIGYDQRHWNGQPCTWGNMPNGRHICCEGIIASRLCIQEELQKITKTAEHYGTGDTVGVHMLALAVILGQNPIYISGIDLDYTNGYANNSLPETEERKAMGMSSMNNTPEMVERILEDFKIIRDSAKNIGVEIYCLDEGLKISEIFPVKPFPKMLSVADITGIKPAEMFDGGTIDGMTITNSSEVDNKYKELLNEEVNNFQELSEEYENLHKGLDNILDTEEWFKKIKNRIPDILENSEKQRISLFDFLNFAIMERLVKKGFKIKPTDEYDWAGYTKEYSEQLEDIKNVDKQDFFITEMEIIDSQGTHFDIPLEPRHATFKDNLHNNWKEIYNQVVCCMPKSVFEVGVGAGYHLKNIQTVFSKFDYKNRIIAGCDLLQSQIDKAKEFSHLDYELIQNIEQRDITQPYLLPMQYEFVFSQAVIMHMSTENAVKALRNMAALSSKYIFLVEGIRNHDRWFEFVQEVLPEFDMTISSRYIDYGILLTRKEPTVIEPAPVSGLDDLHHQQAVGRIERSDQPPAEITSILAETRGDENEKGPREHRSPDTDMGGCGNDASAYTENNEQKAREPQNNNPHKFFVFTEIIGCAEVGKVAIESFHKHHDHQLHIYATLKDIQELGEIADHPNNIFYDVTDNTELLQLYKSGHAGTAYIFAKVFSGQHGADFENIVHFDSDVYFNAPCLAVMNALDQGYGIVGSRRCYVHNPAGIEVKPGTPDTVSTYFFGMKRAVVPTEYGFEDLMDMFLGHNIGLDHEVFDFGDAVTFHALKKGAKIFFIPNQYCGGQDENGSKMSDVKSNLHIDAGQLLMHFGGAGSGCVCFNEPEGKNESYGKWAVVRYALFCKIFFGKDIPVDAGETKFDENGRWISGNYDESILLQITNDLGK